MAALNYFGYHQVSCLQVMYEEQGPVTLQTLEARFGRTSAQTLRTLAALEAKDYIRALGPNAYQITLKGAEVFRPHAWHGIYEPKLTMYTKRHEVKIAGLV